MKYLQFEIRDYRAISGPLLIDVSRKSLFPIIGINESGKTTVLQALFAFDHYNDELNEGRHLRDIANLYKTSPGTPTVSALIECQGSDMRAAIEQVEEEKSINLSRLKRKGGLAGRISISRDVKTRKYSITEGPLAGILRQNDIASALFAHLPYILYFDDFRDKVEEKIEIPESPEGIGGWAAIAEQLFKQTDKDLSIFHLAAMEERQRKSTLAKVKRHLNNTLTSEWQNFRLDDAEALEIGLEFEGHALGAPRGFLKLEVVERDANGGDHYFFVSDRSKGFYWFFNFVMKLEFNPKVVSDSGAGSIYLLDEPGSYLHATAQTKLCTKLKALSDKNTVMYCTHSHYLLNPDVIPLSSITVADKDGNGNVTLTPIHQHEGNIIERRSAFQPVIDALQVKPFLLDLTYSRAVIVEGIYDYYCLELFRHQRPVGVVPSVGADSIRYYISLMIAWQIPFRALWDNDPKGRQSLADARRQFGDELADECFRLLPVNREGERRIIQDLFQGEDLKMIRAELELDGRTSFEKTIAALFFSPHRAGLVNRLAPSTHQNFASVWEFISEDG